MVSCSEGFWLVRQEGKGEVRKRLKEAVALELVEIHVKKSVHFPSRKKEKGLTGSSELYRCEEMDILSELRCLKWDIRYHFYENEKTMNEREARRRK